MFPRKYEENIDLLVVNAGKIPVGEAVGASYFSSAESFAMIRGHHVDIAILGALQIDETGQIANWAVPGKVYFGCWRGNGFIRRWPVRQPSHNNAYVSDNAKVCKKMHVSNHFTTHLVSIIITDLAVFKWKNNGYELVDLMGDTTLEDVAKHTEANYTISEIL